jgi:anti-sigma regulatory factor (Ser/Thr protein kinase)
MSTPLLRVLVRRRRDVVLARQHARQVARLLGFDPDEQSVIAAAVFEIAYAAAQRRARGALEFHLHAGRLEVAFLDDAPFRPVRGMRLVRRLPEQAGDVDPSDLGWVVREVTRRAPPDVLEEMRQQNQELLRALHQLQAAPAEDRTAAARHRPAA